MAKSSTHETHHVTRNFSATSKLLAMKNEEHVLFLAIIFALVAVIVVNTVYLVHRANSIDSNISSVVTANITQNKVVKSNQVVSNDAYSLTVSDVGENSTYDPAFAVPDTETILTLTLSITNKTAAPQSFIPSQMLYVRSLDGDYATMHPSSYIKTPFPAGDIAPGKTASGQVSFNVPKSQSRPLLYVDLGWNDFAPAVFDVLH